MTAIQAQVAVADEQFAEAREQFEGIIHELKTDRVRGMTHSEVEALLNAKGTELLRRLYQGYLDGLGEGAAKGEVRNDQGVVLNHNVTEERRLETVFGTVRLHRRGYRQHEVSTLYPIDAQLNMPSKKYSFGVERRAVDVLVKNSFDETVSAVERTTGAKIPKRQVEEIAVRASVDFDAFYQEVERAGGGKTGPILVLTADGKGIVMRKEDLREATRKAASRREHKLTTRLSRGEKRNAKRMAEVAAVYTIEPHIRRPEEVIGKVRVVPDGSKPPPKPEHKRVWASVEKKPEEVLREAFREGLRRDPDCSKQWVALVDGNKTQLQLLRKLAKEYKVRLTIVVDFIHALEYLWKAGHALLGEGNKETETWVLERAQRLLRGQASHVAAAIRRSGTRRGIMGSSRKAIDKCSDYLLKNAKQMRYDLCLQQGYPIATGVIEGACRHLVKDRMDVTGARWGLTRAEAVLKLRALHASGDFVAYWQFHERQEHQRNHAAKYFNDTPALIVNSARSHLRVVK